MNNLRAILFYFFNCLTVFFYGIVGPTVLMLLPLKVRFPIMITWNRFSIFILRLFCGVKLEVRGLHNIPKEACVVLSNHESTYETTVLQTLFNQLCTVLKKELLYIPFFGWGLFSLKPIAIDRASPRDALRQLQKDGVARIKEGDHVLVFPEGTRNPDKKPPNWTRGGANIAVESGAVILPIAHNSSAHWPMDRFAKRPGTVTFIIGEPIPTAGKSSRQLTEQVQQWVTQQRSELEN